MARLAIPNDLAPADELRLLEKLKQQYALQHQVDLKWWRLRPDYWRCDKAGCDGKPHDRWHHCSHPLEGPHGPGCGHARSIPGRSQVPPEQWRIRYARGGRGAGKGWSGTNTFADLILDSEPGEWAVIGPTFADARDVLMTGPSGLIKALGGQAGPGGVLVKKGPWIKQWNVSTGHLFLRNGSIVYTDGANDGALRVQGRNLRGCLADEVGLWEGGNPKAKTPMWSVAWDESIKYAVRLAPAKILVLGTPKANRSARKLVKRLLDGEADSVDVLHTEDNADNLAPEILEEWLQHKGTRHGRQELFGELLTDVEGALITWDDIIPFRVTEEEVPTLRRVLVSMDPSFSTADTADETGVIAVGEGADHHAYVLADRSGRHGLDKGAKVAVRLAWDVQANGIVYETNLAGETVKTHLLAAINDLASSESAWADVGGRPEGWHAPRLIPCQARLPKEGRLEVVAPVFQQHRVHMVGTGFDVLETQLTEWTADDGYSPDRMDSCLVPGTLITTARGDIPIEDVRVGDAVMTRAGWKPVTWSGMTSESSEVGTVSMGDAVLEGTANHPVLTVDRGFVALDALIPGDRILVWQNKRLWSSTGPRSSDIRTPRRGRRGSTSRPTRTTDASRVSANFTSRSGVRRMAAILSLTAVSSITSTEIRSTTTRRTLKRSRMRSTAKSMRRSVFTTLNGWNAFVRSQQLGIAPKKAGNGIEATAPARGSGVPTGRSRVKDAGRNTNRGRLRHPDFAPAHVGIGRLGIGRWMRNVRSAVGSSNVVRTLLGQRLVASPVVSAFVNSGRQPVYNLSVKDQPEFFANGVLVHNCVQALAELGVHRPLRGRRTLMGDALDRAGS